MIVINKNEGTKIPYEVSGKRITFDDDLSLNLAKQEKDWPVHIDVCVDRDGNLCTGTGVGLYYVAQIDTPPLRKRTNLPKNCRWIWEKSRLHFGASTN